MPSTAATFYPATTKATQTPANPSGVYDLVSTTPTGAANTTTTLTFSSTTQAYEQVEPFTANSTTQASAPAVGAAANGFGWRMLQSDLGSTATAQRIVPAGNWTFTVYVNNNAPALLQTITASFYVIVYALDSSGNSTEAFRAALTGRTFTAAATQSFTISGTSESQITLSAGGSIQVEYWIQSAATSSVGATTNTVFTFEVGGTTTPTSVVLPTGLRTLYTQAPSDTTSLSDSLARTVVFPRAEAENLTTTDSIARALKASRSESDSITTTDVTTRVVLFPRAEAESISTSDAVARVTNFNRSDSDTFTTSDSVARGSVSTRRLTSDNYTTTDAVARTINYGRFEYDNVGSVPRDYHGVTPTKAISGYVYDQQGNAVSGVTVYLVREVDNAVVQTTTSNASGFYSFTRDAYDPNTYHVTGKATINSTQVHGTSDWGLTGS